MAEDNREKLFELDKAVHVCVFGRAIITEDEMKGAADKLMRRRSPGTYWFVEGFYGRKSQQGVISYDQDILRCSTDIRNAFIVVEHMRKDGYAFRLTRHAHDPVVEHRAVVSFVCSSGPCEKHGNKAHNHHGAYDVEAPTSEQAICLAALTAVNAPRVMVPEQKAEKARK
jgi:hypothetical protein